jgi:hypothetical protein
MVLQPKSQGYYVLWTECCIMRLIWAGRECKSRFATCVDIGGYRKLSTRQIARPRNAAQRSGTRAALMAGHENRESRRGVAVKRRQRSTDDAIMPGGHNIRRFLVMGRKYYCSFAYSALACFRMGTSGSASFQRVRKAQRSPFATEAAPPSAPTQQTVGRIAGDRARSQSSNPPATHRAPDKRC